VGSQLFVGLLAASAVLSPLVARAANLFALENGYLITKIDLTGTATTIATLDVREGGVASNLRIDGNGNLFVSNVKSSLSDFDILPVISKIDTSGTVSTFAIAQGGSNGFDNLIFDKSGNLFATNVSYTDDNITIRKFGTTGISTTFATVPFVNNRLSSLVFDGSGNLFALDSDFSNTKNVIRKFDATGAATTFATPQGVIFTDLVFDSNGSLFAVDLDFINPNITNIKSVIRKFDAAGAATTFATNTQGSYFYDLVFDGSGNLFAAGADLSIDPLTNAALYSYNITKFDATGTATTFATSKDALYDLKFDESGNLFALSFDPSSTNQTNVISKIDSAGTVTTFFTPAPGTFFSELVLASSTNSPTPPNNPNDPNNPTTAVPEPFTIIGTLVGGTAAIRLRKKLKSDKV
jgi:hypothetical protein